MRIAVIDKAAEAYRRHKRWRKRGNPPCKCPKPSAADIVDAELDRIGVVKRPARDQLWALILCQAFEIAEDKERNLSEGGRAAFIDDIEHLTQEGQSWKNPNVSH